jgi:hypothetical protein
MDADKRCWFDLEEQWVMRNLYSASLYKHSDLTEQIIGAFFAVYTALGYGFLENVYVKALLIELKKRGLKMVEANFPSLYITMVN